VWVLIFPLFYLGYFAASGVIANIVKASFQAKVPTNPAIEFFMSPTERNIRYIKNWIADIPLIIAIINVISPIIRYLSHNPFSVSNQVMGYITLISTIVFGIQGYFKKYWTRKSKTKPIDFYFSGYILVGIGVNMLFNFLSINSQLMIQVFDVSIFGFQPLKDLASIHDNFEFIIPVLVVQSTITLIYAIVMMIKGNSDITANIKLGVLNAAFHLLTDKELEKFKQNEGKNSIDFEVQVKKKFTNVNYVTLLYALTLPPVFNQFNVDINEELRKKAKYSIIILANEEKDKVGGFLNYLMNETVELKDPAKKAFVSPEAFQTLAEIVKNNPQKMILPRLFEVLPYTETLIKQYILDALQIIGENQNNTIWILETRNLMDMLRGKSYNIKNSAIQAIISMGSGLSDISIILIKLYEILDRIFQANQENTILTGSIEEDEFILENTLALMLKIIVNDPSKTNIAKILPFLYFKSRA